MGREAQWGWRKPDSVNLIVLSFLVLAAKFFNVASEVKASTYTPADSYLINCGSPEKTLLEDGRTFKSDPDSASYLSTDEDILASLASFQKNISSSSSSSSLPLCLTARIFRRESMYRFLIFRPGWHWLRLYFYPLPHPAYNLTSATFTVTTDNIALLHGFSVKDSSKTVFKEYLLNITSDSFTLKFSPMKNSLAFINAIELVSAPADLIPDSASAVSPAGEFNGLDNYAFEVSYRLNVGGPIITPRNDTLWRTWLPDRQFMVFPQGAKNLSVPTDMIQYPDGGVTPLTAPHWVYATADSMADSGVSNPNFNLTWVMNVDPTFSYWIRLHFCDILSKGLNELYFNVYINGMIGISSVDLSTFTSGLGIPYYRDFMVNASAISNGSVIIQVGPSSTSSSPNAILNGLEVMKMSNLAGSLDGLFSSDGTYKGRHSWPHITMKVAVGFVIALGVTAILLLLLGISRRIRSPKGYEKQKTFSPWLLPLNASHCSFLSSKSKSKSKSTNFPSFVSSGLNLGRFFALNEICEATKSFDEKAVIGVGGFGKVYLGELEDGTKLAIKRGNPSSSQGINEFQTEIQMLSKLRHRHLVSLIGYCDEQSEMILVYEYMAYGPLRDHLYGSSFPHLSWRQRLEICIGAARGLHYLHTGSAQGIIHRDVKTTNILLDENFLAKVSDFGLSKAGPASVDQTHVSTAVKGSFGYLDPEYFRRQQLTEKSDVYSFGVLLFEVLCARPALDPALPREQVNLAEWAMQQHRKGMLEKIIDPKIVGTMTLESLRKYVEATEKCLAEYGVDRPSMGDILWHLEYALQLQGTPLNLDPAQDSDAKVAHSDEFCRKDSEKTLIVDISDDSGLAMGSPIFAENFQGR